MDGIEVPWGNTGGDLSVLDEFFRELQLKNPNLDVTVSVDCQTTFSKQELLDLLTKFGITKMNLNVNHRCSLADGNVDDLSHWFDWLEELDLNFRLNFPFKLKGYHQDSLKDTINRAKTNSNFDGIITMDDIKDPVSKIHDILHWLK